MKHITDFEIIRHGVEHSQYFQGCGTSFTDFDHVVTGIGDTEQEALDDAVESMAQCHSFADGELDRMISGCGETWDTRDVSEVLDIEESEEESDEPSECYWHVSIRYNAEECTESVPA